MVTAIIILSIIGLISATLLYIISRKFHVEEDSRIDEIESILPGANCGGCGYAGCRNFAEQCTKVTSLDSLLCPVGGNEVMQKIAPILGLNAVEKAPRIAVIRCNGSCENRPQTSHYEGAVCSFKPAITKEHTAARSFPRFILARVIAIMGVLAKEIVRQLANSEVSRWIPSPDFPTSTPIFALPVVLV